MGRKLFYKPGSFYRVDDRTGFPQRAERTRRQWNDLIVDERVWEPRQPQDLVKGVVDKQSVPDARPLAPNVFVGPIYLQMTAGSGPGFQQQYLQTEDGFNLTTEDGFSLTTEGIVQPNNPYILYVQSVYGVSGNENGAVILDDGTLFPIVIRAVLPNNGILIWPSLPRPAANGNEIIDYRTPYLGPSLPPYLVTEDGQIITTEDGVPINA